MSFFSFGKKKKSSEPSAPVTNNAGTMEVFQLDRFIKAQDSYGTYDTALREVRNGMKRSHWIWFIFPQIDGMGQSSTSKYYGIKSLAEAKAYFGNDTLRNRLYEITRALLAQEGPARDILGGLDAMKVRSCMTLFDLVSPNDVFAQVLDKLYDGKKCERTLSILKEEIPEVPQELMAMMHGQVRTLIDVLKALNDTEPIKDCDDAQKRLTQIVESNVRYGDTFAFMAIRTLWCFIGRYEDEGKGVDIERLERDMSSYHDFNEYAQEPITRIMYKYSVRKMIKYIQFLNEFRRYKNIESISEDLWSIPFSHCSSNEPDYYYSFSPFIMWRVFVILLSEQSLLFAGGKLDNELLEEAAFKRFDRMVAKVGLEETINRAYGDLGCHPELKGPVPACGETVWGPFYKVEDGRIEKGCGDFRCWPFTNTSFEMSFAAEILAADPNYLRKEGDWRGDLFIPAEDYTLPVYYSETGKVEFKNDDEKRAFIEMHKQDPDADTVQGQ